MRKGAECGSDAAVGGAVDAEEDGRFCCACGGDWERALERLRERLRRGVHR